MKTDACNCAGAACSCSGPTRRAVATAFACAAVVPAMSRIAAAAPATAEDERFMRIAIEEERLADFPFGAVIVRDGQVIVRGRNVGRSTGDPTAHAEMVAIRSGLASHGREALVGSTMYATGEPCAMCMGAILWCRFGRLVFAASVEQLAMRMDQIMISSAELARFAPYAPISITGGVLAEEALALIPKYK
jgi:tRNA(adenine34) deaminase